MKNVREVNDYKFYTASSESSVYSKAEYNLCHILLQYLNFLPFKETT